MSVEPSCHLEQLERVVVCCCGSDKKKNPLQVIFGVSQAAHVVSQAHPGVTPHSAEPGGSPEHGWVYFPKQRFNVV